MNPTPAQILVHQFSHTPGEIEAAGYSNMVSEATAWADRHIEMAAKNLKGLLIEPRELCKFAYATLQRKISEGFSPK